MANRLSSRSGRVEKEDGSLINTADWLYMNQTALGQSSTAESTTQFAYKSAFPLSTQRDVLTETNGATVTKVNGAEYRVRATSTAGSIGQLRTKQLGDYIPEHIFLPSIGVRIPTQPTGNAKIQFGYFDEGLTNGTFLEYNASGLFHKVVSNSTEVYSQEITDVDVSKGHIYRFPFLFYGYGFAGVDIPTLTGKSFQVERKSTYYPNGEVLFQESNLSVTCRVEGDGTQLDAYVGGRQMSVIGRDQRVFRPSNEVRKSASIANTTDYVPMVSVKLKSGFEQIFTQIQGVTTIADANMEVAVFLNGTLTGDSFGTPTDYNSSEVATEWDNSATAISGGDKIYGTIVEGNNKAVLTREALPDLPVIEGDTVSFCLRLISGSNGTATMSANIKENW